MKFGANRSQLYDAQKTARAKWDAAQDGWDDAARAEFAEQVWEPLDHAVSEVLQAVDLLSALFAQVRQDCEFTP
jgi:hypothetical protein